MRAPGSTVWSSSIFEIACFLTPAALAASSWLSPASSRVFLSRSPVVFMATIVVERRSTMFDNGGLLSDTGPMTSIPSITKAEALAAFGGNQSSLARFVCVSRQAVHKLPDGPLPPKYVLVLISRMPKKFLSH